MCWKCSEWKKIDKFHSFDDKWRKLAICDEFQRFNDKIIKNMKKNWGKKVIFLGKYFEGKNRINLIFLVKNEGYCPDFEVNIYTSSEKVFFIEKICWITWRK